MDIQAILLSILGVGILWKVLDLCSGLVINLIFSQEKLVLKLLKIIDDKYIDNLKKKSPKLGKELEARLCIMLDKWKKIIKDEV